MNCNITRMNDIHFNFVIHLYTCLHIILYKYLFIYPYKYKFFYKYLYKNLSYKYKV